MTRSTAIIIALVIAGGVAAALLLVNSGGGSSDTPTVATSIPAVTQATTAPTTTVSGKPARVQVEAAVTSYVSAAEEGDATAVCTLQVNGQGAGATSAQACASKEQINLNDLPALAKLKVEDVQVNGDRADVRLQRFGVVSLQKVAGQWKIAGYRPAVSSSNTGSSSGGSSGSGSSGSGKDPGGSSGGASAPSGTGGASAP